MKYFINTPYTAESLKSEYREFCKKLHPDTGGNAEAFKEMINEYSQVLKNLEFAKCADDLRQKMNAEREAREREEAEERARAEREREEERRRYEREQAEERERIARQQAETRRLVNEWAARLERIPETVGGKIRAYSFADKQAAAAYMAATKRNVKAVINYFFPGLKVNVTISGEIYKEYFNISWTDGPSEKEFINKCDDILKLFVPSYYESDPYADYGHWCDCDGTKPWREAYGGALGNCTDYETARKLSDEGKQQAEELAARIFANWGKESEAHAGMFSATLDEWIKLAEAFGAKRNKWDCIDLDGMQWSRYADYEYNDNGRQAAFFYISAVRRLLRERATVSVQPKEKAPEFAPKYGATYKAIKKALGGNVFFIDNGRGTQNKELNIFEVAEMLANGEAVAIGHKYTNSDGDTVIYGTDRGGFKVQEKRAAKFAAVGINLQAPTMYHIYGTIKAESIKPETLAALRKEAEEIEQQRAEWEREQLAKQANAKTANKSTKASKQTDSKQAEPETKSEAQNEPQQAAGLTMEQYSDKATVIRGYNEQQAAELEAMGGRLNKWLKGGAGYVFSTRRHAEELAEWMAAQTATQAEAQQAEPEPENTEAPKAEETQSAPEQEPQPEPEPEQANTLHEAPEIIALFQALGGMFATLAEMAREAKRFEGVTIPAESLKRWRDEAEQNSRTAADRFAELCACLSSLTPEARDKFDALGVIFWTLSEQLRNGTAPELIAAAIDYARADLFDLVSTTQNPQQAAAVRAAFDPDGYPDYFKKAA